MGVMIREPAAVLFGMIGGHYLADYMNLTGYPLWVTALPLGILIYIGWIYSPLPDSNGGMYTADPNMKWGWPDFILNKIDTEQSENIQNQGQER